MSETSTISRYHKYEATYKRYNELHKEERNEASKRFYHNNKGNRISCSCGKQIYEHCMKIHTISKYHLENSK